MTVATATTESTEVTGGVAATLVGGIKLTVTNPQLWSVREPKLYTLVARLHPASAPDSTVDNMTTTIGLRSIDWSKKHFQLNGKVRYCFSNRLYLALHCLSLTFHCLFRCFSTATFAASA